MLTVGSLFSGIGGIDLGLERAGMKVLWQVEIDEWCRAVLAKHWPQTRRFSDVRHVGSDNLPPVDLLAGGFPCQDISLAGRGAGIAGTRSGLWSEFIRLIRELRPRYVLVENVPALLARGLGTVLGDLAESGYDAEWDCIPASAVGAPHRRDRIWIVAYPTSNRRQQGRSSSGQQLRVAGGEGDGGWLADDANGGRYGLSQAVLQARRDGAVDAGWWDVEPAVGRVAHGIPRRVDRLRGLGNAVVPQVVEVIGRQIVMREQ